LNLATSVRSSRCYCCFRESENLTTSLTPYIWILQFVLLHKVLYSWIRCFIPHSTKKELSVCCDEFSK